MSKDSYSKDPQSDFAQPALSVVVVSLCGAEYLKRCLTSLSRQEGVSGVEIIVVYDESLPGAGDISREFRVREHCVPGMQTPEELASAGVKLSRGEVVALTEDHCIPDENWCQNILLSHAGPSAAVGGAVECLSHNIVTWAFAFSDYYRYLPPVPEGPAKFLTVCNVSYKRGALEKIAGIWKQDFHEVSVHQALRLNGETLWLTPGLYVSQKRKLTFLQAVRERYSFGRLFGSRRATEITPGRRFLYTIAAPAIPLLLLGRMKLIVFSRKRRRLMFYRALPALAVMTVVWSAGEFVGNLVGRLPRSVYIAR